MICHTYFLQNFFFCISEGDNEKGSTRLMYKPFQVKCFQSSSLLSLKHFWLSLQFHWQYLQFSMNLFLKQDTVCFSFSLSELTFAVFFPDLSLLLSIKSGCALKVYPCNFTTHSHATPSPYHCGNINQYFCFSLNNCLIKLIITEPQISDLSKFDKIIFIAYSIAIVFT